jgi:autotransporter-associated beta strand protein
MSAAAPALAQRTLGVDVSYWQGEISQTAWNHAYNNTDREFAIVRSSRGGTTGLSQTNGTPGGGDGLETLSRRYDDPRFIQNMVRANSAGLITGPYHFARPDITTNTGVDEANHFMQMAGVYMRPGYLLPMFDLEAGQAQTTPQQLAQFSLDFSNRIYEVTNIRPSIYASGNYFNDLSGADTATRNALAQPSPNAPSMVSPAFPVFVGARYPAGSGNPYFGDIQNQNPREAGSLYAPYYGPFDDYGNSNPWHIWQYSSGEAPFGSFGDTTTDGDIAQGDIEFVRDLLVPAVWWNDTSGDWSTLLNWNSGQPIVAPAPGAGQATPFATGPLPIARLPGAAGSGPTSGQYDTVILERPNADITVTVSTGTHNVRKLYMREALNITGGSLTINYDPNYDNDFDNNDATNFPNALRSGPISAQFSGPVSLTGGSLSVHTTQLDAGRTFTLGGGTLTFNKLNLISNATTKIAVTGDVNVNPLNNATATITRTSTTGTMDLMGGTRAITVGNGSADVDLSVAIPIVNGGLTKNGAGTMKLDAANTFAGNVTVNGGTLRYGNSSGLSSTSPLVTVDNGATLDMNGLSDTIAGLASTTTGFVQQGAADLTIDTPSGTNSFAGVINGTGIFTKNGAGTQVLTSVNVLGPVNVNAGALMMHGGPNTTGTVTVNGGAFGGIGVVTGTVVANNSGHLAPGQFENGSAGVLTVGGLTMNAGSVFDVEFTFSHDRIQVTDELTLNGGSVNLIDLGGIDEGTYTLFDYGTLVGSVANLGAPIGPAEFLYDLVDTGSAINLVISAPGVSGDFNDDGVVDSGDYLIWKKFANTETDLPNDENLPGPIGAAHYALWQQHFGEVAGGGSGSAQVPEPAAFALIAIGLAAFSWRRPHHA